MRICLALTNLHISNNPLRDGDGDVYQNMPESLYQIVEDTGLKRGRQKKKYRTQRRARLCDDSDDGLITPGIPSGWWAACCITRGVWCMLRGAWFMVRGA